MANDRLNCDVDGCTEDSQYLLSSGDRCLEHAYEEEPKTVEYLIWATGGSDD